MNEHKFAEAANTAAELTLMQGLIDVLRLHDSRLERIERELRDLNPGIAPFEHESAQEVRNV